LRIDNPFRNFPLPVHFTIFWQAFPVQFKDALEGPPKLGAPNGFNCFSLLVASLFER